MEEKLRRVLKRAKKCPFYGKRLSKNFKRWRDLPFTTKADLRTAYPFGLLSSPKTKLATYHESTGSSGEPTASYFTEKDWRDITSRFLRNAACITRRDTVLVKTPYAMVTTAHQMHLAARSLGALVIPADNRSTNMPYPKVIRLLKDLNVSVAWCLPTETLLWAATARALGLNAAKDFPALTRLLVAGETMTEGKRQRIEKVWGGIQVYQDYGSTETGSLAGECKFKKLHLWSDRLHFELVDEKTGDVRSEGRGSLVVTPLHREGMSLVRYRLDDYVEISSAGCRCGSPLPTLTVIGRASSRVRVQGQAFFPGDLENVIYRLSDANEVLFWRSRHAEKSIRIEVEALTGREKSTVAELTEMLFQKLNLNAKVVAVNPGAIVSISQLKKSITFTKPKFLFAAQESWARGIHY